ncbi:MAG: oligosaccharide flippase family protein [bacterium]|nr:oligosaccharide flippase family protein [bacterium]
MRDQTRIIFNTLITYATSGANAVVGFLMVPFLLSHLGKETYGVIGVIAALLRFIVLIDGGIRPAATRQFTHFLSQQNTLRANQVASTAMVLYALITLGFLAISVILGTPFLRWMNVPLPLLPESSTAVILIAFALSISLLTAPFGAALASQLRYDISRYTEIAGSLLRASFIVVVFLAWDARLFVWALGSLVASLLGFFVLRYQARRLCPELQIRREFVSRTGFRDLASFGAYTSVSRLGTWLTQNSGPLVVSLFLGVSAVAHYTPAMVFVLSLEPLSRAFIWQLVPVITRTNATGDLARLQRVLIRGTRYTLLLSGGAAVFVGTLADPIVAAWLGQGFEDTATILKLWCVTSVLSSATGPAWTLFVGMGRLRLMAVLNLLVAFFGLGLGVWLMQSTQLGISGPPIGMLAAQCILSPIYIAYSARICRIGVLRYLRHSFLGPALCLAALAPMTVLISGRWADEPLLALVLAAAGSIPVYLGLIWLVGLSPDDRQTAREYLRDGLNRVFRSSDS